MGCGDGHEYSIIMHTIDIYTRPSNAYDLGECTQIFGAEAVPAGGAATARLSFSMGSLAEIGTLQVGFPGAFSAFFFCFFLRDGTVPRYRGKQLRIPGQFLVRITISPEHV